MEKVLKDPHVDKQTKKKLRLIQEIKDFAEKDLQLKKLGSYSSFVSLGRPYVTYLLRVSPIYELKSYEWGFPFVGKFPYKGYFNKSGAETEAKKFPKDSYDTYIRGVSAYSTLGWFNDPILSSMLNYDEITLVTLIIHELFHGTIFIKNQTRFNEHMANFISYIGTKMFYIKKEGKNSSHIQLIEDSNHDRFLFSKFISKEIKELRSWYQENKGSIDKESKWAKMRSIQDKFIREIKPRLKSSNYDGFSRLKLNNAQLLSYETYVEDLSHFEKLYHKMNNNFSELLKYLESLESSPSPQKDLEAYLYSKNL